MKKRPKVFAAKAFVAGDRHDDCRVLAFSPNHDRLALRLVEDFIQTHLGFSLIYGLHDVSTLRDAAWVEPKWGRGLA